MIAHLTASLQHSAAAGEVRASNVGIMASASDSKLGMDLEDALPERCRPEACDKLAVCDPDLKCFQSPQMHRHKRAL